MTATLFLHALTPVHSGTGQTVAVIELPVAREKATGFPMLPGSSLKGVLRSTLDNQHSALFGSQENAGELCITDQRLLCLPVRSYFGTFAYVASPLTLARMKRNAEALGAKALLKNLPDVRDEDQTLCALCTNSSELVKNQTVYLEDLDLHAAPHPAAEEIANALAEALFPDDAKSFVNRFLMVSDQTFAYLCETGTEVTARIRLKEESKTVEAGGLWYEEAVPAETLFYGFAAPARAGATLDAVLQQNGKTIQVGGDASVGRGLCRVVVVMP